MNEQERAARIDDLVRAMEGMMEILSLEGIDDINGIVGIYDGRLLALRDLWSELKPLIGLRRDGVG